MPHLSDPEDTFRRLAEKAAALKISLDDLVQPALERLAENTTSAPEPQFPLIGDAWHAELNAWKRDAESRAGRYPRGSSSTTAVKTITARGKTANFDPP